MMVLLHDRKPFYSANLSLALYIEVMFLVTQFKFSAVVVSLHLPHHLLLSAFANATRSAFLFKTWISFGGGISKLAFCREVRFEFSADAFVIGFSFPAM